MLVLLLRFKKYISQEIWLKCGRGNSVRYLPVHDINLEEKLAKNLPAFHAITGCDTTSQFSGLGKIKCWKTYLNYSDYLDGIGVQEFSDDMFNNIEKFVIKLFSSNQNISSINTLRALLASSSLIGKLPPTKNSLKFHSLRAYYQTKVWLNSLEPNPQLPEVTECGWKFEETGDIQLLSPILTTLPAFPSDVKVLISCGCKKGNLLLDLIGIT